MAENQDQLDFVRQVQDLNHKLGRKPTVADINKNIKNGRARCTLYFDSFDQLLTAAGIDDIPKPRKKLNSDIFKADIENHIENYKPYVLQTPFQNDPYPDAAIISDIHWPFVNRKVVARFYEYVGDVKPRFVIINGDAWDMYSHTKFPRSHNLFTPIEEETMARSMNEEFWIEIKKRHPTAECIQTLGNHDVRPLKRTMEVQPQIQHWVMKIMKELFTFDGVKTILDPREEVFLTSNVIVFHGYRTKLGDHRDYTHYSCFNGHSHVGGVVFRQIRGQTLFECNSGLSGDPEAKGLTYTPQRITNWTPGFAGCDKLGPRFIPV